MTLEELKQAAMACQDKVDAELLLRSLQGQTWTGVPVPDFYMDAHAAIGYMTGHMDRPDAERVLDLFETEHLAIPRGRQLSVKQLLLLGWRTQAAYADPKSRKVVQDMLNRHAYKDVQEYLSRSIASEEAIFGRKNTA